MPAKVVDASAVAAVLFDEAESDAVARRLAGATLLAPALLTYELANVCLKKIGRSPNQHAALSAAFRLRDQLRIEEAAVNADEVVSLAIETGLTAYDASYLWLARLMEIELVTLDQKLNRVAIGLMAP